MVKVHQKVSGGWRTTTGPAAFAAVRSYTETARKHGQHPLEVLHQLFTTGPWPLPT